MKAIKYHDILLKIISFTKSAMTYLCFHLSGLVEQMRVELLQLTGVGLQFIWMKILEKRNKNHISLAIQML